MIIFDYRDNQIQIIICEWINSLKTNLDYQLFNKKYVIASTEFVETKFINNKLLCNSKHWIWLSANSK